MFTKMRKLKKLEFTLKYIWCFTSQSTLVTKPVLAVSPTVFNQVSSVRLSTVNMVLPILNW